MLAQPLMLRSHRLRTAGKREQPEQLRVREQRSHPRSAHRAAASPRPPARRISNRAHGASIGRRGAVSAGAARRRAVHEQARDAAQVRERGRDDLHARVGVLDPVDRNLMDPQPPPLGEHQQLGVEEPLLVLHEREQPRGGVGADRLEAALRVSEPGAEREPEQPVVTARDKLALAASSDAGAGMEPRSDRQVAVPGQERCDQGQQRAEIRRQVDVHVREHLGPAHRPRRPKRPAATLGRQVHGPDLGQLVHQPAGDLRACRRYWRCRRS